MPDLISQISTNKALRPADLPGIHFPICAKLGLRENQNTCNKKNPRGVPHSRASFPPILAPLQGPWSILDPDSAPLDVLKTPNLHPFFRPPTITQTPAASGSAWWKAWKKALRPSWLPKKTCNKTNLRGIPSTGVVSTHFGRLLKRLKLCCEAFGRGVGGLPRNRVEICSGLSKNGANKSAGFHRHALAVPAPPLAFWGQKWMRYTAWIRFFCKFLGSQDGRKTLVQTAHGSWIPRRSAGCRNSGLCGKPR